MWAYILLKKKRFAPVSPLNVFWRLLLSATERQELKKVNDRAAPATAMAGHLGHNGTTST